MESALKKNYALVTPRVCFKTPSAHLETTSVGDLWWLARCMMTYRYYTPGLTRMICYQHPKGAYQAEGGGPLLKSVVPLALFGDIISDVSSATFSTVL